MTDRDPNPPSRGAAPESEPSLGLRLRLWLACLAGALVTALGVWWMAGTQLTLNADPAVLLAWLAGIGGLSLVVAGGFALWLDRGIVAHLRGLTRGLASGRVQELRGLPSGAGWGELSELTDWAQLFITRQRTAHQASAELERLEAVLGRAAARLEQWRLTERWEPLPDESGAAEPFARELNTVFARHTELGEQNLEAARRVLTGLADAAGDARQSAELAERGFVEATALLTTVRELQRLGAELRQALAELETSPTAAAPADGERVERYRSAVVDALEELVGAANVSVENLSAALRRVQEIASLVQLVSNRATLVALHAVTLEARLPREARAGEDLSHELRLLTAEVREASQRADQLAAEVERQTRAAGERMGGLREQMVSRLDPPVEAPAMAAERSRLTLPDSAARLMERVREMIQDATQKGERLSAAGERASRAAERLLRRLEDETRDVEGLMVRLAPGGELSAETGYLAEDADARSSSLRLLDAEAAGDESIDDLAGPGPASEDEGDVEAPRHARDGRDEPGSAADPRVGEEQS